MYKLSENSNLHLFKSVLLAGSSQDKYVPIHSARVELCKSAVKDNSVVGEAYKEMVNNILGKVSLNFFHQDKIFIEIACVVRGSKRVWK